MDRYPRRIDIAHAWQAAHPSVPFARPSPMGKDSFSKAVFKRRIGTNTDPKFPTACCLVEPMAEPRVKDILAL